jgi:hypothetical protein
MNQYVQGQKHPHSRPPRAEHSVRKALALSLGASALGLLGACSSVSQLTNERVAQSETSLQQAQQTVGKSEHGAVELQQAREKVDVAKVSSRRLSVRPCKPISTRSLQSPSRRAPTRVKARMKCSRA